MDILGYGAWRRKWADSSVRFWTGFRLLAVIVNRASSAEYPVQSPRIIQRIMIMANNKPYANNISVPTVIEITRAAFFTFS